MQMTGPCKETAQLATELMNSATTMHQLHLKVTGSGSYAAHKALNEYYDEMVSIVDDVVEQYQGAREKLLEFPQVAVHQCGSVQDGIAYLKYLYNKTSELQKIMPFSEVVNQLDEVKSLIASTKYKLMFLS